MVVGQNVTMFLVLGFLPRENIKEKDKIEATSEEAEEREQTAPRGRKTANSQGRRKGRITRSMTNEAAAANAAAATEEPPPPLPPPPEPCELALNVLSYFLALLERSMKC